MLTDVASQEISTGRDKYQDRCECSPDDPKILCTPLGQASYSSSNPVQTSCWSSATVHAYSWEA